MSLTNKIGNCIKGWIKVNFFLWIMTYVYNTYLVFGLNQPYSEDVKVWSNFGLEVFTIVLCNIIIPLYIIKGIIFFVKKYPTQAKMIGTAVVTAIVVKSIYKK